MKKNAKSKHRWKLIREKREKRRAKARKRKNPRTAGKRHISASPSKGKRKPRRAHESANLKIPRIFSLIDNPIETLQTIRKLEVLVVPASVKELKIDHSGCTKLDLCASAVMDVTLLRAQNRRRGNQLDLRGTYSDDVDVNMMLRGSGILKQIAHPVMSSCLCK